MKVILIRHGRTYGNSLGKLIGVTDEELCSEGIDEILSRKYPEADIVFASPLKRCVQTAKLIYDKPINTDDGLREMNFGIFENKNHEELKEEPHYIRWLETGCESQVPQGETKREFTKRCTTAFKRILEDLDCGTAAFVVHGGTVMAVLSALTGGDFHSFLLKNGQGYVCEFDGKELKILYKLE